MSTENNILLSVFMGFEIKEDRVLIPEIYHVESSPFSLLKWIDDFRETDNLPPNSLNNLHFHKDWNWLMLVIDKIKKLTGESAGEYHLIDHIDDSLLSIDILITYNSVVNFIKWYNEQQRFNLY